MVTEGTSLVDTMRRIQSARPVAGPNEVRMGATTH